MQPPSTAGQKSETDADQDLRATDALLSHAGLVRKLRGNAAGVTRRIRMDRAAQQMLSKADLYHPAPAPRIAANGVHWLAAARWQASGRGTTPWLWNGFSTRQGGASRAYCAEGTPGEVNLGFTADDDRQAVSTNRRLLAEAVTGSADTPLVTIRQIHSNVLVLASGNDVDRERLRKADGIMTDEPGLLLAVQTADCIPVLVADRKRRAVAAFHAGWRGTVQRIVETGIGRMRLEFGSQPEDLIAAIGPGIGACCYSVGEELFSSFQSQFDYTADLFHEVYDSDPIRTRYPMLFLTQRAPGHSPIGPSLHLDLVEANRRQLLAAGLRPKAIQSIGGCTSCDSELFFSHRASHGHAGRMMSVIGIKPR